MKETNSRGTREYELRENISLFRRLFETRDDVYAIQRRGQEGGVVYSPAKDNKGNWIKPTLKTYQAHLEGRQPIGIYFPLPQDKGFPTTPLACFDFDRSKYAKDKRGSKEIKEDALKLSETCQINDISFLLEKSRSGRGFHAWFFFEEQIPAWKVRLILRKLLEVARIDAQKVEIFPKQDMLRAGKRLGNLIALPLDGRLVKKGRTCFLDKTDLSPYEDQFEALKYARRINQDDFGRLSEEWGLKLNPPNKRKPSLGGFESDYPPCIQKFMRGVGEGTRHWAMFYLASYLRKYKKLDEESILTLIQKANKKNRPPRSSDEMIKIVKDVFEGNYTSLPCGRAEVTEYCDKEKCNIAKSIAEKTQQKRRSEGLTPAQERIRGLAKQVKIQSISAAELLKKELPPGQFWVEKGIIPKGGYILLAGPTKEGKTTLALHLSLHLVTTTTFLNQFSIPEEARILYLFAENTLPGLQRILQKQVRGAERFGWQISNKALEDFVLQPGHHINLDYKKGIQLTDELIREHDPDIVILDPISLFVGGDLNKLENVTRLVNALLDIGVKRDCTWIIISHYRKPSEQKTDPIYQVVGSSGFGNYCESFLGLERYHERRSANYKVLHFLLRQEETPDPVILYRNPETLLFEMVPKREVIRGAKSEDVARIIKEEFGGKASYTPLTSLVAEKFGITKARVGELLREAKDQGLVVKETGKYGKWIALKKFS